ncbi:MAG: hypothetical protein ACRD3L_03420 [Terriglobales bacterium]
MNEDAGHSVDKIARWLGFAGLVISVALWLCTFYFSSIRPECVKIGLAPQIFIASKPRFGILATFVNEGIRQAVVISGELRLDNRQPTLPLSETAVQSEGWEYDVEGNRTKVSNIRFEFFTPFAIKPHDQVSFSLWFVAQKAFKLGPGHHKVEIVLNVADGQSIGTEFDVDLTQVLDTLYGDKESKEQPGIEYPIDILSQRQTTSCPLL